jgi:serine/threonine-protein kinase
MSAVLRRFLGSAVAWFAGAAVAVGVGVLALSLIGNGLAAGSTRALTPEAAPLGPALPGVSLPGPALSLPPLSAISPSPSPTPATPGATARSRRATPHSTRSPTPSATPPATSTHTPPSPPAFNSTRQFTFDGGMIVVRCQPNGTYLISWSPAQGFSVRGVHRGPDTDVGVVFAGNHQLIQLGARCVSGVPQPLSGWHNGDDWSSSTGDH